MKLTARNWLLLFVTIAIVLVIDQLTKGWIVQNLAPGDSRQPIAALRDFFQITRSANTGAAFGLLSQAGDLFLVIAIVVVGAMIYFYPRLPLDAGLTRIAIGLICGGALGNAIDRLRYGHVVDFIHYQIPDVISNISNLADHAIVLGVIIVLVDSWRLERPKSLAAETGTNSSPNNPETPL
ncbi:MAG: signal peptidase II [Anaerolineae bacterium]|nr:signal peptidase II [Anaerolineae bacterium]